MWTLLGVVSALAVEPVVTYERDGTVVATLLVAASEADVRAVMGDGAAVGRLSPDVYSVASAPSGTCQELKKATRGMLRPFHLRTRWCATPTGWTETLVSSDDFTAFRADWVLVPATGGTAISYRVRTDLAMSVPDALLRSNVARASKIVLTALAARVAK